MSSRPSRRSLATALAIAVAAPPAAVAQGPRERAELERFRDSLATTADSVGLLALERRLIAHARVHRDDAMAHLRLGFLALRLGDLGGRGHYDDAASEFQWAVDLQPSWPYAWYGMGLAEYGVGDSQVSLVAGLKAMLGKDALTRSAVAFARAAEVDPGFVHGLVDLAATALRQRVNVKLDAALTALRRAGGTRAGRDPGVLLARGRVEREAGDRDSALAAFRGYLERGPNRALGQLELARTLLLRGSLAGVGPYFEGAASDDSVVVAGYREDLAPIAGDSVLRELDGRRGVYRAAYLRRFWGERDRLELRRDGERLREHYRRLFYARRHFRIVSPNRHYDIVERYRSGNRDFDDRGLIYIRHGEPSARASYTAPNVEPNESWRYDRPDGELLFHFVAREDVQDYKLVESLFDILGFSRSLALQNERNGLGANPAAERLLVSREHLSPIYRRLQGTGRGSSGRTHQEERELGRSSIAFGTGTDSYELRFPRELRARAEVLAVGGGAGTPAVQVAYAIAGSSLAPSRIPRGYLYSVRLRFVAIDGQGQAAAALDTTRHFVAPGPVPAGEHLVGRVAVPVPPGTYAYRVALQQGDRAGITLPRDTVRVGRPPGVGLGLSDLVLGARNANLTWRRTQDDTVYFNPLRTFRRDDLMELYYEVEGLRPAGRYTVELAVRGASGGGLFRKIFGGGSALISLKFEERARAPAAAVHRTLDLDRLKPGQYVLEVTVADDQGRRDRRTRPFLVVDS